MAGGKRLAAALEAGLSEVPCLVERVDDDQARALAAATNVPSTAREASPATRPERPKTDIAFGAFADCLTAVASSAGAGPRDSTIGSAISSADFFRLPAGFSLSATSPLRNDLQGLARVLSSAAKPSAKPASWVGARTAWPPRA